MRGLCLGRDPAREATRDRHLDALPDLLLQPLRGAGDEHVAILVQQQERCGVHLESVTNPLQQLREHVLEGHVGE